MAGVAPATLPERVSPPPVLESSPLYTFQLKPAPAADANGENGAVASANAPQVCAPTRSPLHPYLSTVSAQIPSAPPLSPLCVQAPNPLSCILPCWQDCSPFHSLPVSVRVHALIPTLVMASRHHHPSPSLSPLSLPLPQTNGVDVDKLMAESGLKEIMAKYSGVCLYVG